MIIYYLLCAIETLWFGAYEGCAWNVRAMRLGRNISQKYFVSKVGIALPTYRRFESTGEISLRRLIEIAKFFDVAGDFKNLFTKQEYSSIEDDKYNIAEGVFCVSREKELNSCEYN